MPGALNACVELLFSDCYLAFFYSTLNLCSILLFLLLTLSFGLVWPSRWVVSFFSLSRHFSLVVYLVR